MSSLFPLADEALEMWLERNPDMARHRLTNTAYHQQFATMRVVLLGVEQALEAEGIGRDVRKRVLNTAVFGAPDPDAVMTADQIRSMAEEQLGALHADDMAAERDYDTDED